MFAMRELHVCASAFVCLAVSVILNCNKIGRGQTRATNLGSILMACTIQATNYHVLVRASQNTLCTTTHKKIPNAFRIDCYSQWAMLILHFRIWWLLLLFFYFAHSIKLNAIAYTMKYSSISSFLFAGLKSRSSCSIYANCCLNVVCKPYDSYARISFSIW